MKVKFVEAELESARNAAAGERTQAEVDLQTKAQHAELLRKVEQINVLTDSNRLLRQEKDSMQPRISELTDEVYAHLHRGLMCGERIAENGTRFSHTDAYYVVSVPKVSTKNSAHITIFSQGASFVDRSQSVPRKWLRVLEPVGEKTFSVFYFIPTALLLYTNHEYSMILIV